MKSSDCGSMLASSSFHGLLGHLPHFCQPPAGERWQVAHFYLRHNICLCI